MDNDVYRHLQRNFQRYAECVGMVDTGYFKRSERHALVSINPFASLDNEDIGTQNYDDRQSSEMYRLVKYMLIFLR